MNHPTSTDELSEFFANPECEAPPASESGKIDQIIALLERLVTATESQTRGSGSRGTYDLPQAKKWIVESLEELGPQTRGSLNTRMLQSRRSFLDPALNELVTENTVRVVEPELGRKGPRNPRYATPDQAQSIETERLRREDAERFRLVDAERQRAEAERQQVEAERHTAAVAKYDPSALTSVGIRLANRIVAEPGFNSRGSILTHATNETERDLWATALDELIRIGRIEERDGQLSAKS